MRKLRIAYIAAGAGHMYCGSCIRDNALVARLQQLGHDALLLPIYTPLRTDEHSVSHSRVFYGAINVYLQQRSERFAGLPRRLRRWLDSPRLLRRIGRRRGATDAHFLGELTLSMLQGEAGHQKAALEQLVRWLRDSFRPDVIHLTNSMLIGLAHRLREDLPKTPIVTALQGEDIFLEDLPEPYRAQVLAELRRRCCDSDLFVATSLFYAEAMAEFLRLPAERIRVTRVGVNLEGLSPRQLAEGPPWMIGYLGRLCPEKGLHLLIDAFRELAQKHGPRDVRLRVGGYLGGRDRDYVQALRRKVTQWGLEDSVEWLGELDRAGKIELLQSLHVLSMPTTYREPKGLPILEAMACGVPVVQPAHGAFPEILERTGGGILVAPNDSRALAQGLESLLDDPTRRREFGLRGRAGVSEHFSAELMAEDTLKVYRELLGDRELLDGEAGLEAKSTAARGATASSSSAGSDA